jgi:predicted nuclease of predicted toxin-antitoxin system
VRLLLDEHYSPKIAEELRNRGHDVVSVKDRDDLRGLTDRDLWSRAIAEGRVFLTDNVADFMPLVREAVAGGDPFMGVVFTSPRSMPRSTATIGTYVTKLDQLLHQRSRDDALASQVHWLTGE